MLLNDLKHLGKKSLKNSRKGYFEKKIQLKISIHFSIYFLFRSINLIRNFSGNDKFSESIINEFYMHGSLEMSSVLLKLLARIFNEPDMKPKSTDLNQIYAVYNTLVGTFTKLIEDNFIERLPQLIEDASNDDMKKEKMPKPKIPNFMKGPSHEATKHFLPSLSIEGIFTITVRQNIFDFN